MAGRRGFPTGRCQGCNLGVQTLQGRLLVPRRTGPGRYGADPFSSNRNGFEVRTYRLCRRFLSFHDFPELGPGPTPVAALALSHAEDPAGSTLTAITRIGPDRHRARCSGATPPRQAGRQADVAQAAEKADAAATRHDHPQACQLWRGKEGGHAQH